MDDAARLLERDYRRFGELRPTLTPERLNTLLTMRPPGFTATLPRWAMLRQIVNRSTIDNRGQVDVRCALRSDTPWAGPTRASPESRRSQDGVPLELRKQ